MRRKRRARKLQLASAALEEASESFPSEHLEELVAAIQKLCSSKMIRGCSICTDVVEETAYVCARLISEANDGILDECIQYRLAIMDEIVQNAIRDSGRHKSALWSLGLCPCKHDEVAMRTTKEKLRQADSNSAVTITSISSGPIPDNVVSTATTTATPSSPPRWTKFAQIVCQGAATVAQDIPLVAPVSAIPKAVGAAAKAFATRYENTSARDELRNRVVAIEALGRFQYLQEPIDNFQQVSQTMDSRRPLKRLVHASSEEQLLLAADKKFDRGLVMQNLAQALQTEQRLHDKINAQTLILFTGMIFFSVTEARSVPRSPGNFEVVWRQLSPTDVLAATPVMAAVLAKGPLVLNYQRRSG